MNPQHVDMYLHLRDELDQTARKAFSHGQNYRNFCVGCAVLAYSRNKKKYGIFEGANVYIEKRKDKETKTCAEQTAVNSAITQGFDFIVAIVVAGQCQADDRSQLTSPTLHPCWGCRIRFRSFAKKMGKLMSWGTLIRTIHPTQNISELHSLKQLWVIHKNHQRTNIQK